MDRDLNPLCRRGIKYVRCSHYEECLNHAANGNWSYWDCSECPYGKNLASEGNGTVPYDSSWE